MVPGKKIGLLGPPGTFAESAIGSYDRSCTKVFFSSHEDVFNAVASGEVDEGIVAIENKIHGLVVPNIDMFIRTGVKISKEIVIPIHHCLAILPGTQDVTCIISHPQAMAQCSGYVSSRFPQVKRLYAESTAGAMKEAGKNVGWAAIGPLGAAASYGLKVLDESIEDMKGNETRFFLISNSMGTQGSRTSMILACRHEPGALYRCLKGFSDRGINLLNIMSRPLRNQMWEYYFYVEVEGSIAGDDMLEAMSDLNGHCVSLSVLGSYGT